MTPSTPSTRPSWQRSLANSVKSLEELLRELELTSKQVGASTEAAADFPLRVPRSFLARMEKGNPQDPLLLQVLPTIAEVTPQAGFTADPLAESKVSPAQGVLHKFQGRALLVLTGACAVHCRYCFRRHFPYGEHLEPRWEEAVHWLAENHSIEEVLLSGGDPLSLPDDKLSTLIQRFDTLPHLRRLRLHTRQPIVLPNRVDDSLLHWLTQTRLRTVVVVHVNHPQELNDEVAQALHRLTETGATLLNQSVLLRGVNDQVEILRDLSERLFEVGVMPYYLHLLDRVQGAAHFEVGEKEAHKLYRGLLGVLPGYLVPRLVREVPGEISKVPFGLDVL